MTVRRDDPGRGGEAGSASPLTLGVCAALLLLATTLLGPLAAFPAQQRADAAADAGALAAADARSGRAAGEPCELAGRLAAAHGAQLDSCELDGPVATVAVTVRLGWIELRARARAGPPPGAPESGATGNRGPGGELNSLSHEEPSI